MNSTEEGMPIDESDEQPSKTELSIRDSLELDSKVTAEIRRHLTKHLSPMNSTEAGMQIDESDEQPSKAELSIRDSFE
jgi:hypothetical protein